MRNRSTRRVALTLALASIVAVARQDARAEDVETIAVTCAACHGESGVPIDQSIPVIWGQNEGYLYLQLRDIQRGSRTVEAMKPVVAGLEKTDLQELAAYFSAKSWPDLAQPRASDADARQALQTSASVGCNGCHGAEYQAAGTVPRLAGQQHTYLAQTMLDFRAGVRANNPGMTDLMNAAEPADLQAMASYLSGL